MSRRLTIPQTTLIETQSQLDALCADFRALGRFAFDTEFVMEDRYQSELCLVQLASENAVAIVDPFLPLDLSPIWRLVHDGSVLTIVHAGQEDLALCVQHTGEPPQNIFDVQIAAGLVSTEYPLSLQKLVQSILHVRLHKSRTLTDWRRRPLSPEQVRYAADDVAYLPAAHARLAAALAQRGRSNWIQEECARFEAVSMYKRDDAEKVQRLKGGGALRGQPLAVAEAIIAWRDQVAQKYNRPARVLLKDHLLVEIAKQSLTTRDEIRHLRGINLSDRDVIALGVVVKETLAKPVVHEPHPSSRDEEPPGEAATIALITAVLRGFCHDEELAYGLVATKRSIQELIRHRMVDNTDQSRRAESKSDRTEGTSRRADGESSRTEGNSSKCLQADGAADPEYIELLTGWRGQAVGIMLDEVLAGKRSIGVVMRPDGPHVRLV